MAFGSLSLTLVSLSAFLPATGASITPWLDSSEVAWSTEDWLPLDDPDADGLPSAFRALPNAEQTILGSLTRPRFLLVRELAPMESVFEAFETDMAAVADGEFLPESDGYVEIDGREAVFFDCAWSWNELSAKVATLYVPSADGTIHALWIVSGEALEVETLRAELTALVPRYIESLQPPRTDRYAAILLGHEVSFNLVLSRSNKVIDGRLVGDVVELLPVATPQGDDPEFMNGVVAVNPQFAAGIVRQWADEGRGVSLSYQVFVTDTGLGPANPFVQWVAGQLQTFIRGEPEKGDTPVEHIHLPEARTRIVDDAEVARHYENNQRAPDAGVILEVYLPRSPLARACQLRWSDEKDGSTRYSIARLVELRDYRRSRSETITRTAVVLLLARTRDEADRELLENHLDFACRPLESEGLSGTR